VDWSLAKNDYDKARATAAAANPTSTAEDDPAPSGDESDGDDGKESDAKDAEEGEGENEEDADSYEGIGSDEDAEEVRAGGSDSDVADDSDVDGEDLKAKLLRLPAKVDPEADPTPTAAAAPAPAKPAAAAAAPPPPRPSDVTEGRTVFVRGVPFDMDEEALKNRFSKFGGVVYAKVVCDKATGVSRGTGFVKVRSRRFVTREA
jgi:hypothetical protein